MPCDIFSCNGMRLPSFLQYIRVLPILNVLCTVNLSIQKVNFNVDGVDIALQVDLSQNASLNHQDGIQLVHWFQEQAIYNLCMDSQGCRRWFLCQRQLCHCLRSKETQVYVPVYLYENSMCRPESQLIEFSVGEYLQFKQRFLFSNFHLWKQKYK